MAQPIIDLLLFSAFGIALLLLLWGIARSRMSGPSLGSAWDTDSPGLDLPPGDVVDRIFSTEDLRYAAASGHAARRMLLHERTALSLLWLSLTRDTAQALMRNHAASVLKTREISLTREMRLVLSFLMLLAICEFVGIGIGLWGPFRTRGLLRGVQALSGQIAALTTGPLAVAVEQTSG